MTSRRQFLLAAGMSAVGARFASADDACTVFTKNLQSTTTPAQALARLKDGNGRFVAGKTSQCDVRAQVRDTAGGQAPFAAVLACMDSRVAPELVFDQSIGDLFAVRIAGNFVNSDILGSLEYATQVAGAKLIVVLGHTECGAVKGAVDDVKLGHLTGTLAKIRPAVAQVAATEPGAHTSQDKAFVQEVANQNAKDAAAALAARSRILAALVAQGKLQIVPAMHDVGSGEVTWLG